MIQTFPEIDPERALGGFGINLGSQATQEWAYQEAKAEGCSEGRFQIAWSSVEDFDAPGTFDLTALDAALALCREYGMRPMIVAGYAPPWKTVKTITVQGLHPIGSTSITTSTDVSDLEPGRDHVGGAWYQAGYFGKQAYYGAIVHDVDPGVIHLGAATVGAIPDGTVISVNRLLYPSVDALVGSESAARYADYVEALALRVFAAGIEGRIEIWNEPPWFNDGWDARSRFYDNPAGMGIATWTYQIQALVLELVERTMPTGVKLVGGGTHKSGAHGLLRYLSAEQVANSDFVADACHPYGPYPEYHWWGPASMGGTGYSWGAGFKLLEGASNFAFNAKIQNDNPSAGLEYVVSEIGAFSWSPENKRNFDLRTLISGQSMQFAMINFYSLADTVGLALVDAVTKVKTPSWKDMTRWLRLIKLAHRHPDWFARPTIESWAEADWNLAVLYCGPLMVVYQRTVPPVAGTVVWPRPSTLTLEEAEGTLLVLDGNGRGHAKLAPRSVSVGAKPMILTWRR